MSPLKHSTNIAARMGRWSAAHRRTAIIGWLVFVLVAFAIGIVSPMTTISDTDRDVGESGRADRIIDRAFDLEKDGLGEVVVVQSDTLTATSPEFRRTVDEVVTTVGSFDEVSDVQSPYDARFSGQISPDGHAAMVTFAPRGSYEEATAYIDDIVAAVDEVQGAHPDLVVAEGGVSTDKELDGIINSQLARAGLIAIPLTIGILLLVMGTGLGALVPVFVGLTSVLATMGLVSLPSAIVPMDEQIAEVILLVGLAVGVDYSIFYMRRERDERRAGRSERAALEAAAATSGRAVLVSGVTVMGAMAGLFLSGNGMFMSFAIGSMMVVGVAMIGSLTVLPAMLSALGDRVHRTRIPFLRGRARREAARAADGQEGSRVWGAILRPVLRHPVISTVAATAVLVVMAIPALSIHPAESGLDAMPRSEPALEAFHVIDDAFPGGASQAVVAVRSGDARATEAQIDELTGRALATGEIHEPVDVERSPDGSTYQVSMALSGAGTDAASDHALATLRDEIIPATIGTLPDAEYGVTGGTAASRDFTDQMTDRAPLVFAAVMLFAFGILLMAFRSIVVALKAIVLNLLSVAAAYGVMVGVFQWGWGEGLLDFNSTGGIASWLPMFMFVILFGLSMDYHVFILSKVRELYDRGMDTRDAVEHGIRSTAGVVTGAAAVMVAVFSVFALLPIIDMKEMGIGLATAILIDATIVRAVLLPASMTLLGDRNWYLPSWLRWLPRLEHEREPAPEPAPLPEGATA
ncbi:MAG TPA: MMPL family transporter [Miltoncostaeaceae bacterium]|nr:MMPL family transporter [Miltoncostaeaceae bacterium]